MRTCCEASGKCNNVNSYTDTDALPTAMLLRTSMSESLEEGSRRAGEGSPLVLEKLICDAKHTAFRDSSLSLSDRGEL